MSDKDRPDFDLVLAGSPHHLITSSSHQSPSRPRWQEVRDLQQEGLDRAQIAEAMGICKATVRFYECEIRAREEMGCYQPHGSEAQAERMARRYPDWERQEWIRREMALRDELIEHKRRRGL